MLLLAHAGTSCYCSSKVSQLDKSLRYFSTPGICVMPSTTINVSEKEEKLMSQFQFDFFVL